MERDGERRQPWDAARPELLAGSMSCAHRTVPVDVPEAYRWCTRSRREHHPRRYAPRCPSHRSRTAHRADDDTPTPTTTSLPEGVTNGESHRPTTVTRTPRVRRASDRNAALDPRSGEKRISEAVSRNNAERCSSTRPGRTRSARPAPHPRRAAARAPPPYRQRTASRQQKGTTTRRSAATTSTVQQPSRRRSPRSGEATERQRGSSYYGLGCAHPERLPARPPTSRCSAGSASAV